MKAQTIAASKLWILAIGGACCKMTDVAFHRRDMIGIHMLDMLDSSAALKGLASGSAAGSNQ